MDIDTQSKLLQLKGFLNRINHISYTYSQLGKTLPMNNVTQKEALQLVSAYELLIDNVKSLLTEYARNTTA